MNLTILGPEILCSYSLCVLLQRTNLIEDLERFLHCFFHLSLSFDMKTFNQKLEMLKERHTQHIFFCSLKKDFITELWDILFWQMQVSWSPQRKREGGRDHDGVRERV